MKDQYIVEALRFHPNVTGNPGSVFARYANRRTVPLYVGMNQGMTDLCGYVDFTRRADGFAMMATVHLLSNSQPWPSIYALWNRGKQLYVNPHMKRSYEGLSDLQEVITFESVVLETFPSSPPGFMAPLFTWP